jgi:hypothetical protein
MLLARSEHAMLFVVTNAVSILCISAMYYHLFDGRLPPSGGGAGSFLAGAQATLEERVGAWAGWLFLVVAVGVFVTSELGILDFAGRLCAGIVAGLAGPGRHVNPSRVFQATIGAMAVVGSLLILVADPRSPYWYLVTSASLNTLVMAVYFGIVAWANRRMLAEGCRSSPAVTLAVAASGLVYGAIFAVIVARLLA